MSDTSLVDSGYSNLKPLLDNVASCPTVTASAKMLIEGICAHLLKAGTDQATLSKLHNDLANDNSALASAVARSTIVQAFESTTPIVLANERGPGTPQATFTEAETQLPPKE